MAASDTGSGYECDAPGSSTNNPPCVQSGEKKFRLETVHSKCVKIYLRQDLKASETQHQRWKKVAKTSSERSREFRARRALLKQQSMQQEQPDSIDETSTEDIQIAGPSPMNVIEIRTKSAEATRKWREKNRCGNALLKKKAKTASQRMREYRQRKKLAKILLKQQSEKQNSALIDSASREQKETNMNIESYNHSAKDEGDTSNMYILLRNTREIDVGQSYIGDICAAHSITNSNEVEPEDGNTSGSCIWPSFEPSKGSFSVTKNEGSFNNRTTNDQAQQSLDKSVIIKNEPFSDSSICGVTGSSFVDKEIFQDFKDFESLNHGTQYFNQSVKIETGFDVKVERDEHTIYGQYIAERFRKCKRNDTEVNAAKNHIESILFDLSTGAYSYICFVDKNQIDQSDKAHSLLTPDCVVQAIIVKEEVDL